MQRPTGRTTLTPTNADAERTVPQSWLFTADLRAPYWAMCPYVVLGAMRVPDAGLLVVVPGLEDDQVVSVDEVDESVFLGDAA